jgi:hypothetical protein
VPDVSADVPKSILDSADITAVTQLILRERESRDLGRWQQMGDCFWPDSLIRVSWFQGNGADFVTGSMNMARRGLPAKHRLAPILVTLSGSRAVASLSAIIDLPVKLKGVEATLSTHSRFLYRAGKRDGCWRIVGFDAVYMRDELTSAIPGHSVSIEPKEVQSYRPSYRMLSHYLNRHGFSVDSNLPGEDRPDLVAALNLEVYSWAGLPVPS